MWKVFFKLKSKLKKLLLFFAPNFSKIINHKIIFKGYYPNFEQVTYITGEGMVEIGNNCNFGFNRGGFHRSGSIELQPRFKNAIIKLGNNITTNNNIFICAANYIEIEDNTLIGQYVTIMDFEAHNIHPLKRMELGEVGKILIGKNVWIGNNVTILKNSQVGDNSIIATGAVVTGIFPSNVMIGGIPAKIIKTIDY